MTAATPVIRRRWTDEQKRQLVWDGLNSGQPLARYARRQGIHASVVHRWLRAFAPPMLTAPQAEPRATLAAVRIGEPAKAQAGVPPHYRPRRRHIQRASVRSKSSWMAVVGSALDMTSISISCVG
ncbi:MAG: transposase [Janthinobacterium lividum]